MTLEEEEHEGGTSPQTKTGDTDSLLDELEEAERRRGTSLPYNADGMSAADLIAAAVTSASNAGFEYEDPSDTVAVVAMGTKASESTMYETAAAAVGGDGAAPGSPRGPSSSATKTSAPVPSSKMPLFEAGKIAPPGSGVPPGSGASSSTPTGSAASPALAPSSGSPSTHAPIPVRTSLTTPSPSGAPLPPAGVQLSNRKKLAAAMGTVDFEMVDPAKPAVVVDSLVEATEAKISQLG
jgi:hypothetical protein